ncbi:MAG: DUF3577 domain-containing protein [Gammaproteobacteria bacterium]|nr:DUF3577 domain-containing protein [Gammaproteobacteria bacterium]
MQNADTHPTSTPDTKTSDYFNLHATGIGYLRRARHVTPDSGDTYLAVTIAALRGRRDRHQYTYFDCIVAGRQAQAIIRRLMPDIEAAKPVLVRFKIGDVYPELFIYRVGPRQGEPGTSIKARLLKIEFAMVGGIALDITGVAAAADATRAHA